MLKFNEGNLDCEAVCGVSLFDVEEGVLLKSGKSDVGSTMLLLMDPLPKISGFFSSVGVFKVELVRLL